MLQKCPVCCTDFDLWREIIDEHQCGLYVEPDKPERIKQAIQWYMDNPEKTKLMGERGYQAVISKYNWSNQDKILLSFYSKFH